MKGDTANTIDLIEIEGFSIFSRAIQKEWDLFKALHFFKRFLKEAAWAVEIITGKQELKKTGVQRALNTP